jgi:hypothetical protein
MSRRWSEKRLLKLVCREGSKSFAADRVALLFRVLGQEARFSGGLTGDVLRAAGALSVCA